MLQTMQQTMANMQ
jgi:hypothetical protein